MHDLLEGICRYDVARIFNNFKYKKNLFSLNVFNNRLSYFNHSLFNKNIPLQLQQDPIKNNLLILSAFEMFSLVVNLNFIIGDLIPTNNPYWKLYLLLREIISIIALPSFSADIIDLFDSLVTKYLKLLLKLKLTLKLKHYLLVYYSRIMKIFGPLKNMSSMRFEGKHKQIKENSKVITSRENPCYTLSLKHQLQLCDRLIRNEGFSDRITYGTFISNVTVTNNVQRLLSVNSLCNYDNIKWFKINGTHYSIGNVIRLNSETISFGRIKHIITKLSKTYFIYHILKIMRYSSHLNAYKVEESTELGLINQEELLDYNVYIMHISSDKKYYISSSTFNNYLIKIH